MSELRIRAELLRDGGPQLWEQLMDELREVHIGIPRPAARPTEASDHLRHAYAQIADRPPIALRRREDSAADWRSGSRG